MSRQSDVSPTSIRSRILKVAQGMGVSAEELVSPTSIRSRILKVLREAMDGSPRECFTHVDPFEDTES